MIAVPLHQGAARTQGALGPRQGQTGGAPWGRSQGMGAGLAGNGEPGGHERDSPAGLLLSKSLEAGSGALGAGIMDWGGLRSQCAHHGGG